MQGNTGMWLFLLLVSFPKEKPSPVGNWALDWTGLSAWLSLALAQVFLWQPISAKDNQELNAASVLKDTYSVP